MKSRRPKDITEEEWNRRLRQSDKARLKNYQKGRDTAANRTTDTRITTDTRNWIISPIDKL